MSILIHRKLSKILGRDVNSFGDITYQVMVCNKRTGNVTFHEINYNESDWPTEERLHEDLKALENE